MRGIVIKKGETNYERWFYRNCDNNNEPDLALIKEHDYNAWFERHCIRRIRSACELDKSYSAWFERNRDNRNPGVYTPAPMTYTQWFNKHRTPSAPIKCSCVKHEPYDEWFNRNCEKSENTIKKYNEEKSKNDLINYLQNIIMNEKEENEKITLIDKILEKFDIYMRNIGYDIIFKDLTSTEKKLCLSMVESNSLDTSEIAKIAQMSSNNFNKYRQLLIEKGIIESAGYGKIDFVLPRFKQFVSYIRKYK